jgi:hypothetical protein
MTTSATRPVSLARVPVSTTETVTANHETGVPRLAHLPQAHQRFLIGRLVHMFGWTLGQDGNLYSPNPVETAWGERVA